MKVGKMLYRDGEGIILQHDIYNMEKYPCGGDSSRTTGIMSLFGSEKDKSIVHKHYVGFGLLVRHPSQTPWCDPSNFSRDQLSCLAPALPQAIAVEVYKAHLKRGYWFLSFTQNSDVLLADSMYILAKKAGEEWIGFKFLVAYLIHLFQLIWHTKIKPNDETNQIICQTTVFKTQELFKKWHPDWERSVLDYFCEGRGYWRDQKEIAFQIISNY